MIHSAREQLAELLLGTAPAQIDAGAWDELAQLAQRCRVTPQLVARIEKLALKIPEAAAFKLQRQLADAFRRSAMRASKGIAAMTALRDEGIRAAAFKGLAAMARLYDGPKWRTVNDADVLLLESDVARAVACLESRGFVRQIEAELDEYSKFVAHSPSFAGNQAIALLGPAESEIDLHWAIGRGLDASKVLGRASPARLLGEDFLAVSDEDGLLLTVRHAMREDLQIDGACRDLCDARLWFRRLEENGCLAAAIRCAEESGMTAQVCAIAEILRSYDSSTPAFAAPRQEQRMGLALAELFRVQLRDGPIGKDLAYLVHPAPARQMIAGLARDWSSYRRIMRDFEQQMLGGPLPWWRRAGRLAQAVRRSGLRRLRLVRTLARVKYD